MEIAFAIFICVLASVLMVRVEGQCKSVDIVNDWFGGARTPSTSDVHGQTVDFAFDPTMSDQEPSIFPCMGYIREFTIELGATCEENWHLYVVRRTAASGGSMTFSIKGSVSLAGLSTGTQTISVPEKQIFAEPGDRFGIAWLGSLDTIPGASCVSRYKDPNFLTQKGPKLWYSRTAATSVDKDHKFVVDQLNGAYYYYSIIADIPEKYVTTTIPPSTAPPTAPPPTTVPPTPTPPPPTKAPTTAANKILPQPITRPPPVTKPPADRYLVAPNIWQADYDDAPDHLESVCLYEVRQNPRVAATCQKPPYVIYWFFSVKHLGCRPIWSLGCEKGRIPYNYFATWQDCMNSCPTF